MRQSQERQAKWLEALLEKKEMYFQREGVWDTGPALTHHLRAKGRWEYSDITGLLIKHENPLFLGGREQLS